VSAPTENGSAKILPEDLITIDELARRLNYEPKTVRNKMGNVFKKGIHYAEAPGLPVMFKWSAVLELYQWRAAPAPESEGIEGVEASIPMARGYSAK